MPPACPPPKRLRFEAWPGLPPHAAGLDIGARALGVAVPPERDAAPVRALATFTPARHAVADWLLQGGIDTGARASTAVSWVALFALLEVRGSKPDLVNARPGKTVPGRTSDGNAAPWLPKWHALGVVQGAFRPDAARGILRPRRRHRAQLIAPRAPHLRPMPHALTLMTLPLREGRSDLPGVTGQARLRALVAGARDPVKRAPWRNPACQSSPDQLANALTGTWREEPRFMLKQALEWSDAYPAKSREGAAQSARQVGAMTPRVESDHSAPPWPPVPPGSNSQHTPGDQVRAPLMRLPGGGLGAVTGISAAIAQTILSEVGTALSRFPTVKHCCSGLGLAPHPDRSGGRVWRSRTLQGVNRATQAFRPAAQAGARSPSALGAYVRSRRARLGPEHTTVAPAHKIARVVEHLLRPREEFQGKSAMEYEQERRERELKHLSRRAPTLGDTRIPAAPSQPAPAP